MQRVLIWINSFVCTNSNFTLYYLAPKPHTARGYIAPIARSHPKCDSENHDSKKTKNQLQERHS